MHIVFISSEYPLWSPGGVGSFLKTFGSALVTAGNDVSILGVGSKNEEEYFIDNGMQIYRLPMRKIKLVPGFMHNAIQLNKKIKQLHKENPINIIEAAEGGLALISKKHKIKKVIRLHGGHHFFAEAEKRGIEKRKGKLEKVSFAKADAFIAVSNYVKTHTEKYLSYENKPITVLSHPMDTDLPVPDVIADPKAILFAGTVCEKKGVQQLIEAFKIVREALPEKELHIYGRDWSFPNGDSYIEMLKSTFDRTYFANVTFHGNIQKEALMNEYAKAAVCVFPSHMETQGLVTLEAMLFARPVVFSKYGPGPETIDHTKNGLLCDVYNPADIAEKIISIFDNPEHAETMGKNARALILKRFNLHTLVADNVDFYKSIL